MGKTTLTATIKPAGKPEFKVNITIGGDFIDIAIEGYGDYNQGYPDGTVVAIDFFDPTPQVVVYGDVNSESPTNIIKLEGAAESNRVETEGDEG
jgi:hypothetical protein